MSGATPGTGPGVPGQGGLRALGGQEFSFAEAVGGWRGLVESVAPGLVFVVVFVGWRELTPALVSSLAVTLVAVIARLARRGNLTYALGGVLGVLIGALWAWRSGEAQDYYVWGLLTNAVGLVAVGISLAVRYPLVGLVVSAMGLQAPRADRGGEERPAGPPAPTDPAAVVLADDAASPADAASPDAAPSAIAPVLPGTSDEPEPGPLLDLTWRKDPHRYRPYAWASWLWFLAFGLRLLVQVPLYAVGSVGWLGTARLVMGVPMWALVLWVTWLLVRPRAERVAP